MTQIFSLSCLRLFMVAFVPLFLLISGCTMKNATVAKEKRITLSDKTDASEVYKSGPLTVIYEYQRAGNKLTISGSVEFLQSVDSLDVRIVFVDATGLVLGKKIVYSSGFRSLASKNSTRTFRTNLVMPDGVAGFSFSESSKARASHR